MPEHFRELRTLFGDYALRDCALMRESLRSGTGHADREDREVDGAVDLPSPGLGAAQAGAKYPVAAEAERHHGEDPSHRGPPPVPALARALQRRVRVRAAAARPENVGELPIAAVNRLEKATARADSDYIASRSDWVLSEDPDLKGLRGWHKFQEFQLLYLPSDAPLTTRPRNVQQLENSRYVRDLCWRPRGWWERGAHAPSRARRDRIRRRCASGSTRSTSHGNSSAKSRCNFRHARTRLALIDGLRAGAALYGFARPAVPCPRYADEALGEGDACEPDRKAEIERANLRLSTLAERDRAGARRTRRTAGGRSGRGRPTGRRSRPRTSAGAASITRRSGNRSR